MSYLTSPDSPSDATVRETRFHRTCAAAAAFLREGQLAFSLNHERMS